MDKCAGFFGLIFGHKFESYLISSEPADRLPEQLTENVLNGMRSEDTSSMATSNRYDVHCARCGKAAGAE